MDPGASSFQLSPAFGTPADGLTTVALEFELFSLLGRPIAGAQVELTVSGYGNLLAPLPLTGMNGRTSGTLASLAGEQKALRARVQSGGRLVEFGPRTAEFLLIPEHTYFVRQSGSDAASGRSPREAWRSLDHALAVAEPGATVHVGAGLYAGPLTLERDSGASTPFVLNGDTSGSFTGDAGEVVIEGGGGDFALRVLETRHAVLRGLTLRGAASGLRIEDAADVRVLACSAYENEVGLWVDIAERLVIQDCRASVNRLSGLRLEAARASRIENNLIYANLGTGLSLFPPAEGTQVRFNTFYRNGDDQLREEESGGTGAIQGNILAEGGASALALQVGSGYQSLVNLVWGNDDNNSSRNTPDGTVEADPLFVDPFGADGLLGGVNGADDDFRLLPGSVAFDLGGELARDVVLGSHESLATRSSREDGVLEASADDLAAANLGYHPVGAAPAFHSLPQGGGRIAHAVTGDVRPHLRAWERGLAGELGLNDEAGAPLLEAEIVFLEQRVSPLESPEELLCAQVNTGTQGRILVRHWDGRRWGESALAPYVEGITPAELVDRRFDVEYDASGRALFVYADGDALPSFQILERGGWSAPQDVSALQPGEGRVRWVQLVARRGSNEMALVTLDDQRDLVVTLWNGSAWGTPRRLETSVIYSAGWRPFDAAFESQSGDLLVSWGFNSFIEETRWATLERATGQWRVGQHPSTDAIGASIVLAADPTTNRIAAVMGEADFDDDIIVSVWNGVAWVDTAELTLIGPPENRMLELGWIGNTGLACAVFRRLAHAGSFEVALLQPTGWRIQPAVELPGVGKAAKVRLVSLPDTNQMLGAVLDADGRLFGLRYDGRAFSLLDGGAPLATGLDPAAPGRPFDVAVRRPSADGPQFR